MALSIVVASGVYQRIAESEGPDVYKRHPKGEHAKYSDIFEMITGHTPYRATDGYEIVFDDDQQMVEFKLKWL